MIKTETRYMVRPGLAEFKDAELWMHTDGEDAWTLVCKGPLEAIQRRFDALMAARA